MRATTAGYGSVIMRRSRAIGWGVLIKSGGTASLSTGHRVRFGWRWRVIISGQVPSCSQTIGAALMISGEDHRNNNAEAMLGQLL